MAVKKADLQSILDQQDVENLAKAETFIDSELRKRYRGDESMNISIPPNLSNRARTNLMSKYQAAGWTVKFDHDQREGDFIVLS